MNYVIMKRVVEELIEKVGDKQLVNEEFKKYTTSNLSNLIMPLYILKLPLGEQKYLIELIHDTSRARELSEELGIITYEIILNDGKRFFNTEIFSGSEILRSSSDIQDVLEQKGYIYVSSSLYDGDTREIVDNWSGRVSQKDIKDIHQVILGREEGNLHQVLTASEAEDLWGYSKGYVRKSIERERFNKEEYRKSAGTYQVTYRSMQRLFGCVPGYRYKET